MKMRPMPICAAVCIGVSIMAFSTPQLLIIACLAIFLFCIIALFKFKSSVIPCILALLMTFSASKAVLNIEKHNTLKNCTFCADFTVMESLSKTKYGYSTVVRANGGELPQNTKLKLYCYKKITPGDIYRGKIKVKTINKYHGYYYSEGIYSTASLKGSPIKLGENKGIKLLDRIRCNITSALYANTRPDCAATLNALTVGEKSGFSSLFSNAVRRSGVSHVMVVSGMHLSIIMGAVMALLGDFGHNKYLRAFLVIFTVGLISALCGFTTSIIRAGITYIFMAFSPVFERNTDSLNTLSAAVVFMLLFSPFAVYSISFQLSVLSTLGILVVMPAIMNVYHSFTRRKLKLIDPIVTAVVITLSATLLTLPVIIYNFEEVSVIAPITNILITFAVTGALIFAAAALILNALPVVSFLSYPLFWAAQVLTEYVNTVILKLGTLQSAAIHADKAYALFAALPVIVIFAVIYLSRLFDYRKEIKILKDKGVIICR